MYVAEEALNGPLHAGDSDVIHVLQDEIRRTLTREAVLVSPLGLGGHVDHQLTRQVAEGLEQGAWYYADFPYVLRDKNYFDQLEKDGWTSRVFPISPSGLAAWTDAISAHASQISTFWESDQAMRQAVADYLNSTGGVRLWRRPAA